MQYKTWSPARRLLALLALLPLTVLILGTLYMLGMDHLEGSPRTLLQALQWASETMTNTGYGADNRWNHPVMAMFVIITPFIGQCLVFLIFPVLMRALHGMEEAQSSLLLIPGYILAVAVGVLSGSIGKVLNSRVAILLALCLITVALLLPAFFVDAPPVIYIVSMALFPSGFALMYAPLVSTAVRGIAPDKSGVAIGFYNLTINMAIPIGIAYTFQLISLDLGFMAPFASPAGTPFASVLMILSIVGVAAILMFLSFSKILFRGDVPEPTVPIH